MEIFKSIHAIHRTPFCRTHVIPGVHQKVEGARLVQQGTVRHARRDLADNALNLLSDGLLRLAQLLLDGIAVDIGSGDRRRYC